MFSGPESYSPKAVSSARRRRRTECLRMNDFKRPEAGKTESPARRLRGGDRFRPDLRIQPLSFAFGHIPFRLGCRRDGFCIASSVDCFWLLSPERHSIIAGKYDRRGGHGRVAAVILSGESALRSEPNAEPPSPGTMDIFIRPRLRKRPCGANLRKRIFRYCRSR